MTIAIHGKALSTNPVTGVERYAREIIGRLLKCDRHFWILYVDQNFDWQVCFKRPQPQNVVVEVIKWPRLWTLGGLTQALRYERFAADILYVPAHALPFKGLARTVAVIHGLEFLRLPACYKTRERMYLEWTTRRTVRHATRLIAVSKSTADDIRLFFTRTRGVTVVPHGSPRPEQKQRADSTRAINTPSYFLYLGRVEPKKNIDRIRDAFVSAKKSGKISIETRMLFAGSILTRPRSWGTGRKDCEFLGYITEARKRELLKWARALVFVSLWEGFGLPILEAQSVGTPVITSDQTWAHEVAGSGALFVDPFDVKAIEFAMGKIAQDAVERRKLISSGRRNLGRFSWDKSAKLTLEILERAAAG